MAHSAHTLNCLMCGAPARSDSTSCEHCGARLATVACPSCFGMIFQGSRFCPLCGSRADREVTEASTFPCPRCEESQLTKITIGKAVLCECPNCEGFWIDKFSFEQICTDRAQQAAVLGPAIRVPVPTGKEKIRYVKCPECHELMQRMNFASCSGVVIDVCREHGSWFDYKELQRIIEFIRSGGLDRAREKQIADLEEKRRRLQNDKTSQAWESQPYNGMDARTDAFDVVGAAGSLLLHFLLKR